MNTERIRRFIEVAIPSNECNFRCSYCYLSQNITRPKSSPFAYEANHIRKCLSKERLGGRAFFNFCANGETLFHKEVRETIKELLAEGHMVKVVTNMSLANRVEEFIALPEEQRKNLLFTCSLHYFELQRLGLMNQFFENIRKLHAAGISAYLAMVLCNEYIPHLDEIKARCIKELGQLPQLAVPRDQTVHNEIKLLDHHTAEELNQKGKSFESPLFNYSLKNFNYPNPKFCYAGDWSFFLNLATGEVSPCYNAPVTQNIFNNPNEPIKFKAIGRFCRIPYCINSDTFMVFGLAPERKTDMRYGDMRYRPDWITPEMCDQMNQIKLNETNRPYSLFRRMKINYLDLMVMKATKPFRKIRK